MINLDADKDDADWLKQGWDFLYVSDLLGGLDVRFATKAQQRAAIAKFMKMPAARAMPRKFRAALVEAGLLDS